MHIASVEGMGKGAQDEQPPRCGYRDCPWPTTPLADQWLGHSRHRRTVSIRVDRHRAECAPSRLRSTRTPDQRACGVARRLAPEREFLRLRDTHDRLCYWAPPRSTPESGRCARSRTTCAERRGAPDRSDLFFERSRGGLPPPLRTPAGRHPDVPGHREWPHRGVAADGCRPEVARCRYLRARERHSDRCFFRGDLRPRDTAWRAAALVGRVGAEGDARGVVPLHGGPRAQTAACCESRLVAAIVAYFLVLEFFPLPLFTGVRGRGILRTSDAASCIVHAYRPGVCHSTSARRIQVNTTSCDGG